MAIDNNEMVIAITYNKDIMIKISKWTDNISSNNVEFIWWTTPINGKYIVILMPSGSKKNWPEDKEHEKIRNDFIKYIESFKYEDESSPIRYIEVGFGECGQKILKGNNSNSIDDSEYCIL